ncbi:MAG: NAD(P)-dependent oxidoreductase [Actinobacteria bacterium]|nr:NAD(P)-dependent oxidoreductase [Actinomycetota bacterium]
MKKNRAVGLVGFGQMGAAIASRLRGAGHTVRVFDSRIVALARAQEQGFEVAPTLKELACGMETIFLCIPDQRTLEAVLTGRTGIAHFERPLAVCIDLSGSPPDAIKTMSETLAKRGTSLIDAAFSGGLHAGRRGNLMIAAGGEEALVQRIRPMLSSLGSTVIWAGPPGAGTALKALNTALSAASFIATAEIIAAGRVAGVVPDHAVYAINESDARTYSSEVTYPLDVLTRVFKRGISLGDCHRDLACVGLVARASRHPLMMTSLVREALAGGVQHLGEEADFTRMYDMFSPSNQPVSGLSGSLLREDSATMTAALFGILLLVTIEVAELVVSSGIDPANALLLFNASSGRNQCTTALAAMHAGATSNWPTDSVEDVLRATQWVVDRGVERKTPLPLTSLAGELWRAKSAQLGPSALTWPAWKAVKHLFAPTPEPATQ